MISVVGLSSARACATTALVVSLSFGMGSGRLDRFSLYRKLNRTVDSPRAPSARVTVTIARSVMQKNLDRLTGFLALLPRDRRFTIEFRHESWFEEDVFAALREHDIALCVSESEEFTGVNVATASWGYLRLHRQDYDDGMLAEWRSRVTAQAWTDAHVFFKHDYVDGSGPLAVERFVGMIGADGGGVRAAEASLLGIETVPARA